MDAHRTAREKEIADGLNKFMRTKVSEKEPKSDVVEIVLKQKPKPKPKPKRLTFKIVREAAVSRRNQILKILKLFAIIGAVFLAIGAIIGLLMTGLLVFQNQLFYPVLSVTTTTKVSGAVTLNVGQLCQWNNQCPPNAYCLGTCQCSDNYYFNSLTGYCDPGIHIIKYIKKKELLYNIK